MNNGEQFFNTAAAGGYSISRSLRFNAADSSFLSRTPASSGSRKTWTWAGWVKRSALGAEQQLWHVYQNGGTSTTEYTDYIQFNTDNTLGVFTYDNWNGFFVWQLQTTQVFRDPGAWFHLIVQLDTTNATSGDRAKIFVNGTRVTAFATASYPSLNYDTITNSTYTQRIGTFNASSSYFSGLLADIHFIDGQALTPTSFGEFSATTGVWVPKAYSGPAATGNSFWLPFSDNSAATATTLGKDNFNLGNNFTPNNLSVTAGAGNDSLVDVPVNGSEVDSGLGNQVRGNYCTLNPLQNTGNTLSNGNLDASISSTYWTGSTINVVTGKWYVEFTVGSTGTIQMFGLCGSAFYGTGNNAPWATAGAGDVTYYVSDGRIYVNAVNTGTTSAAAAGDIISFAFDADARSVEIRKNNTLLTTKTIAASTAGYNFYVSSGGGVCTATLNFGQRPFAYPVAGYKCLNTASLPAPQVTKPSTAFDVKLYTGNGSSQTISGLGFSPDLVWAKARNVSYHGALYDTVRGATKLIYPSLTNAEETSANSLTSFNSDGFSLGADGSFTVNSNGNSHVAWCWDAGNTTVTNTQGSITSQVRANASAGFSIVTYTGTGSAGTVGHGLGVAPSLIIVKSRSNTWNWVVYHASVGNDKVLAFNTTAAAATYAAFANTNPTSSVFSLTGGADKNGVNNAEAHVAYCFTTVAGLSAFGSYTGNGSADGPFVYTGFRPRWIMLKRTDSTSSWAILDATRLGYNVRNDSLYANLSDAEANFGLIDILSNGFKLRATYSSENGGTHIYAAFAESPFAANNRAR
jgi:hypothetical protein